MKNSFKSHFFYNKRQRNGIFFLLALIIIIQLSYFYLDFIPNDKPVSNKKIIEYQKQIDSLKKINISLKNYKIKPFNPSFITDYKGYKLGLSIKQINKLLAFRNTGKYINSAEEFQQITGVNDSMLAVLKPYFKFPNWVSKSTTAYKNKTSTKYKKDNFKITDLNSASAIDLQQINGIGVILSNRIIKYRTQLKGFYYSSQLYEVWNLDTLTANRILERFKILNKPTIKKLNINTVSFKELLHLPYIDYELTKKIMNYRRTYEEFQTLEELKKIDSFPIKKYKRIALYLKAE